MNPETGPDKAALHEYCVGIVTAKIAMLESNLAALAESVANETKSSAGDKYETARAMLHMEQEQVRRQLRDAGTQLATLQGIDPHQRAAAAGSGSLVNLDGTWHYLSTALGRIRFGADTVIVLSLQSPLGALLKGRAAGDSVSINGGLRVLRALH